MPRPHLSALLTPKADAARSARVFLAADYLREVEALHGRSALRDVLDKLRRICPAAHDALEGECVRRRQEDRHDG